MRVLRWASRFWTGVLVVVVLAAGLLLGLRLLLPLLPFSARPALAAMAPPPNALGVAPRAQLTLRFTTPMNPRSVERALQIEPAAPLDFAWSQDNATLTITPTQPFASGTRYTLAMRSNAQSRWFRSIEEPAALSFQIAPAPAVLAAFPQPGAEDVALDAALSLSFSRPIVAAERVGQPFPLSLLRFEPPIEGSIVWLDPATALFQPAAPLRPGTRYTATVEAGLVDANGGELPQPYSWSFSTPAPRLLSIEPADGAARVPLRSPIVLHFSQPFELDALRAALVLSPTVAGQFTSALLPDATQVVTFTPDAPFTPDTAYTISLLPGLLPAKGNIELAGFRGRFRSAPQPALSGRFPGDGQVLPDGQQVRLIFNTPVDGLALQNGLNFDPSVKFVVDVSGNEARISAPFAAATVYTATIIPDVTDSNGVALGRGYQLRFRTAPAAPALLLPDATDHVVRLAPGAIGPRFRRTNLSQLDAGLYALDEDSTVRLLAFTERDWRDFSPERAGLTALRQWSQPFTDTLNTAIDATLAVLDGEQVLPNGSYYLRLRAPDGLRQDVLLFVGDTQLVVQRSPTQLLVWATDAVGAPIEGAALALYRGGALVERGQSGPNGIWRPAAAGAGGEPLLVSAQNGGIAVASASAQTPAQLRVALLSDRTSYAPRDIVQVAGFVRASSGVAPLGQVRGTLALRSRATSERVASTPIELGANGVISASVELPRDLVPGSYLLSLGLGSQLFTHAIEIAAANPVPTLALDLPRTQSSGAPLTATLTATTSQGLPLASVPVSWTVHFESLSSLGDDFIIGEEQPVPNPTSGGGQFGRDGRLAVVLSSTLSVTTPLRLVLDAQAATASGTVIRAAATSLILPASETVGLRLFSRIVQVGEAFDAELLARDLNAAPVADRVVLLELYRSADGALPNDAVALRRARVLSRSVRTGADGRVTVSLALPAGGRYLLVASATGTSNHLTRTVMPLWATANDFSGWPQPQPGQPLPLVADRARYQPGDVAMLLLPAAIEPGTALVGVRRAERLDATVQPVRAGGVITVSISAESPLMPVEMELGGQPAGATRTATALLPVALEDSLHVAIASNAMAYRPGSTATFTITTTDAAGHAVPADIVFGITNQATQPQADFEPGAETSGGAASNTLPGATLAWQPGLRTDATGLLSVTARLTDTAQMLFARVWAADSAAHLASAQQTFAVTQPLALALEMPPSLRVGDTLELRGRVRNTGAAAQQVRLALSPQGLDITNGDLARSVALAVGEEATLVWQARVQESTLVRASLSAQSVGIRAQQTSVERHVLPAAPNEGAGVLTNGRWAVTFTRGTEVPLEISVVPDRAGLVRTTIEQISAAAERSPADVAALLQLTASETPTTAIVRESLAALARSQRPDGGWSWWPNEPSDPELTLFVLEGLAARSVGSNADTLARRAMQFLASQTGTSAEVRRIYAETVFGETRGAQIAALARTPQALDANSISLLLLARPPDTARNRVLADLLQQRIVRDGRGAHVVGAGYGGDLAATALAARALIAARPNAPVLDELQQYVAAAYTPAGWPNSFIAVSAVDALADALSASTGLPSVALNGRELIPATSVPSETLRLLVAPAQLQATNTLTVTADGDPALVGYRYAQSVQPPVPALLLRREYLTPETGQPADVANLHVGQLIEVRLTLVARQSLRDVAVEELLPGGMLLADLAGQRMRFGSARFEAGVYQYRYTMQAAATGTFLAPAPLARLSDGTTAGIGNPVLLTIIP